MVERFSPKEDAAGSNPATPAVNLDTLKSKIRNIPDWPKPGVIFGDITPVLEDKEAFSFLIDELAELAAKSTGEDAIDKIVGIDARGFLLASALAYKLKTGLVIVRKKGKLPYEVVSKEYALEYAAETLEIHSDTIKKGEKILIVDDVLATGGTMKAASELVEELGGAIAGILFFIELSYLKGREKLKGLNVEALVKVQ